MSNYISNDELLKLNTDLTNLDLSKCNRSLRSLLLISLTMLILQINTLSNEEFNSLSKNK